MVKTKETQIYECSICGKEYNSKEDAENCEVEDKEKKEIENIERATKFTITENHIKLLKHLVVGWYDCEFGAPCIDPKRPYGNSDVIDDIAEIIGIKKDKNTINYDEVESHEYEDIKDYFSEAEWKDEVYNNLNKLHKEMQIVLQIIFTLEKIEIGDYLKEDEYNYQSWKKLKEVSNSSHS